MAKSKKPGLPADSSLMVLPGATHFPQVPADKTEEPEPLELLPPGVSVRSKQGVQIEFAFEGKRCTKTIRCKSTVKAVREAAETRKSIILLISQGRFSYEVSFPGSQHRGAKRAAPPEDYTVGMGLDDWLAASWGSFSHNTKQDYVRIIRNKLKPLHLGSLNLADELFVAGAHSASQPPTKGFSQSQVVGLRDGEPWPTSTVPTLYTIEDVPLDEGESPSTRRRRRMKDWKKRANAAGALSPLLTKSVARYKPVQMPLQCLAQLRVSELTDVRLSAVRVLLRDSGLMVPRVNNIISPLRQAFARLLLQGRIYKSPFDGLKPLSQSEIEIKRPAKGADAGSESEDLDDSDASFSDERAWVQFDELEDRAEPDPLSIEEMLAVLEQFDEAMRNHYTFAFFSGLRTGELIGLREKDYDPVSGVVRVRRSLSRSSLKATKSEKERTVELLPPARQALEAQLALLGAPNGWLFPNPFTMDRWRNESKLTSRWKKALQRGGVRYRRPYHTRHTFASMLLSAGENLLWVAGQLGHADWHMVQKRYAKWLPSAHGRPAGSAVAAAGHATWPKIDELLARHDLRPKRGKPVQRKLDAPSDDEV